MLLAQSIGTKGGQKKNARREEVLQLPRIPECSTHAGCVRAATGHVVDWGSISKEGWR